MGKTNRYWGLDPGCRPADPPTPSGSIAGRTMQESVYNPKPAPKRLPADAPNILIVLIDDAGPGLPTALGGEFHTPTLDRIRCVYTRHAKVYGMVAGCHQQLFA